MRLWLRLVAVLLFFWMFLGSTALAEANRIEAQKHFEAGEVHYRLGHFLEALDEYSKAYELLPLPGFLFNIGQCQRQLHNYQKAIFFLEGYLREKPAAKNRPLALRLIEECKTKLEQQQQEERDEALRKKELAQQQEQTRQRELEIKRLETERQIAVEMDKKREQDKKREEEKKSLLLNPPAIPPQTSFVENTKSSPIFYKTWWFWTIVGVVLTSTAGGTVYAVTSSGKAVLPSGSLGTIDRRNP
jgi:tetratricopeptide (TPR) repeat protein